jgi:deoxyhypusine synthase
VKAMSPYKENNPEIEKERKKYLDSPITQLEITNHMTAGQLVEQFSEMSIQARNLGNAARIWEKMLNDDSRPTIFLGLTGPLIAAGLRKVIAGLIRNNMVDVVVSTGAIIYQDYLYCLGAEHYHGFINADNKKLRDLRINRIYDVFTDDHKFEEADDRISKFAETLKPGNYSSRQFISELAKTVDDENSILKASHDTGVPIFIPALNDSSIGIGLTKYWAKFSDEPKMTIDSIKDNYELVQVILNSKKTSAVYIGGGVPKNFVNDAIVMANFDFDADIEGHSYAIQVSTAIPMDGGLSGSTLNEAVSWGKIKQETRNTMVFSEASIGLPLLYTYLIEKGAGKRRVRTDFKF